MCSCSGATGPRTHLPNTTNVSNDTAVAPTATTAATRAFSAANAELGDSPGIARGGFTSAMAESYRRRMPALLST